MNFKGFLNEMGEDFIGFDDFIKESEEILRRHQSKANLIQDPPVAERFIKYIPVYQPIERKSMSRLFNEMEIYLKPFNKTKETIVISNVNIGHEVEIVAVEYLI